MDKWEQKQEWDRLEVHKLFKLENMTGETTWKARCGWKNNIKVDNKLGASWTGFI
jgi:hypothetical protein